MDANDYIYANKLIDDVNQTIRLIGCSKCQNRNLEFLFRDCYLDYVSENMLWHFSYVFEDIRRRSSNMHHSIISGNLNYDEFDFSWSEFLDYYYVAKSGAVTFTHDMVCRNNPDGGGTTGGGGGGGTTPPTYPDLQPECNHVICGECNLPIGVSGSTTRSIPSCSHSEACECWWGSGHNKLMDDALSLTKEQLDAVKEGSKDADKYQRVEEAHRHAMVETGKTLEEAKCKMREHFVTEIKKYKESNDYKSLGHALHMIQDIYSPAHSLKDWNGSVISYIPHIFEGRMFNRTEFNDALNATMTVFEQISRCESDKESIGRVFDDFLRDFERQYTQ